MNAQVYEMSPDKSSDSASWYVLRLKMKPGDTIYAARKGIVNDMYRIRMAPMMPGKRVLAQKIISKSHSPIAHLHDMGY